MQDFEKLGVFYLGKQYDMAAGKVLDDLVLYKSKDLTTHAVIIGMTGSGKTGLGISMLEEAAIDNIPVIAIDPKGDLANIALTFPELKAEDFRPWVNPQEATNRGLSREDYAASQAALWQNGLADWGQDGSRIARLRSASDVVVYTPGSSSGRGVSVLRSFDAPGEALRADFDAYRDMVQSTVTGLLTLVGLDVDPLVGREHILLANVFEAAWTEGRSLGLADIVAAIQAPPFTRIGVMDLDAFYPARDRFALAMRLNSLLASPGFKSWLEGEPLDVNGFLYGTDGKARVSVFSIAHLSDSERMFFVTMLLNELIAWMRSQPGTGSLRALLYMDELFGYLPPTANPPSKLPLLTMLKQARAYGLGLVLSTQNPVDLDYKALSNAGTWFIGRLQTERDKSRVLAGLEGAAAGGNFDRRRTEQILAGLDQRVFYLHSVHNEEPLIMHTRWVMSYLAGPMTREQLAALPGQGRSAVTVAANRPVAPAMARVVSHATPQQAPPSLPPQVRQIYLPALRKVPGDLTYVPTVLGLADINFSNARHGVNTTRRLAYLAPLMDGAVPLDWKEAEPMQLDFRDVESAAAAGSRFAEYPKEAASPQSYTRWEKLFGQHLRADAYLRLLSSPTLKLVSEVGEDERDFRIRLQHLAHEKRDEALEALRKRYASRTNTLFDRERRARQALERQSAQARQRKLDAAVSTGTAILGALFGNKAVSTSSVSRVGTAMRSAGRVAQSGDTVAQAQETLQAVQAEMQQLENELAREVDRITESFSGKQEALDEVVIRATATGITIHMLALAWAPHARSEDGTLQPLYK